MDPHWLGREREREKSLGFASSLGPPFVPCVPWMLGNMGAVKEYAKSAAIGSPMEGRERGDRQDS